MIANLNKKLESVSIGTLNNNLTAQFNFCVLITNVISNDHQSHTCRSQKQQGKKGKADWSHS